VLLDIRIGHPLERAEASASCLEHHSADGLLVCPVTLIEMVPAFRGDSAAERMWLENLGISSREPWLEADTVRSHSLWNALIADGAVVVMPLSDIHGFVCRLPLRASFLFMAFSGCLTKLRF